MGLDGVELVMEMEDEFGITITGFKGRREANVWRAVQQIVAEQLGQPKEKVTPHARFVEDLGLA
jgi:acyl carrier protein